MKKIIYLVFVLIINVNILNAKWWIFGKSNNEVEIRKIQISDISSDDNVKKLVLYKDNLKDGKVYIKGKAYSKEQIGKVQYSLDDKKIWQDAKFSENGDFEFSFTPEINKVYTLLIEATDTVGKTNKVDETLKEIQVSNENPFNKVKDTLNDMFKSYSNEELNKFMSYVADDFAGDKDLLSLAVKNDFNALSDIKMRYTINNIAMGSNKIFVSLTYNRTVFVNKTGQISTDNGITEFVFETIGDNPLLYSMKKPLLFGLSDADNVATGEVLSSVPGLIIDNTGNLSGASTIISLSCSGVDPYLHPLYYFSTGEKGCHYQNDMNEKGVIGEFIIYYNQLEIQHNGQTKEFNKSIDSLTEAEVKDLNGYQQLVTFTPSLSKSYGVYILGEFYAIQMISLPNSAGVQNTSFKLRSF